MLHQIAERLGGRANTYQKAIQLLQDNHPRQAWRLLRIVLRRSRNLDEFFLAGVCLSQGLGQLRDAVSMFARANEIRWQRAQALGVAHLPFRVLDNFWTASIGHIATLDYVIKLGQLEGRDPRDTILYTPAGTIRGNAFLLEQFRPALRFVELRADLPFDEEAVQALRFDYLGPRCADGTTMHFWELAAKTHRRWYARGGRHLLTLPDAVTANGWRLLNNLGIPDGAWFVALHVRSRSSKVHNDGMQEALNAEIGEYLPAIAEITQRGGWVIRMGDPSMAKLPSMPNVFDYCHSELRADWMDIFIASKCRFFLGTSSGPAYVPPAYGVSSVLSNWWPPSQRPWHPTDIFVPKLFRRRSNARQLSLREMLVEPFGYCTSLNYLANAHGVMVEDNEPEDIRLAVVEMFERIDGTANYTEHDLALRRRADEIHEAGRSYGLAQVGRDFLRRHESLLE